MVSLTIFRHWLIQYNLLTCMSFLTALPDHMAHDLIDTMESILPVKTLLKFYKAFCDADPHHALVQCVDIMSDDQSMLLKKRVGIKAKDDIYFE